jgi:glycosyltransferase involved in cell wall biosynthesis
VGGAERTLARLAEGQKKRGWDVSVASLLLAGPVAGDLEAARIPVTSLGMRRGKPLPAATLKLARLLRRERPDVVQTWMYHANVAGSVAHALARSRVAIIWNIRASNLDLSAYPWMTGVVVRWGARMSALPDAVVINSEAGRRHHERLGFHPRRWDVIPNGIDISSFVPDDVARADVRRELGLTPGTPVIGLLARLDPMKDHETFFGAAEILARRHPTLILVLAGEGVDSGSGILQEMARRHGVAERTRLLGVRSDVGRLLSALDVLVLTSRFGEGFPNVVAEAMACAVPCVVTETGDSAAIVGDTGRVVRVGAPNEVADACSNLLGLDTEARRHLGAQARERITESFGLERCLDRYEALYETCRKAR